MVDELNLDQVYRKCEANMIGCNSSQELTALETIVGKDEGYKPESVHKPDDAG